MTQTVVSVDPVCGLDPRIAAFGVATLDQQAVELARTYGIPYVPVVLYSWDVLQKLNDDEVTAFVADSRLLTIQPNIDEPGDLGFHADVAGVIFSRCKYSGDPLDWTTPSHENAEMTVDPTTDQYRPLSAGKQQALEVSDRVEGDQYGENANIGNDSMLIQLSNYLLPSAFIPGSAGPWDRMGRLTTWDGMTSGGYEIVLDAAGNTTNVFARLGRVGANAHATVTAKLQRADSRLSKRLRGRWAP